MKIAYRQDLDWIFQKCGCHTGCTDAPEFFHSKCHTKASSVQVKYKEKNVLELSCILCGTQIITIKIVTELPTIAEGNIINSTCHSGFGLQVKYKEGTLDFLCGKCHAHAINIKVAERLLNIVK
jgi:hypothetical protein